MKKALFFLTAILITHLTYSQIVFKQIQFDQDTKLFATNRSGINEIFKTYDERDLLLVDVEIFKTNYKILELDFEEIKKELQFEKNKTIKISSLFSEKIDLINEDQKKEVKRIKKKLNKRGFLIGVLSFLAGFIFSVTI
jgi:uncharacterized protein YxeA